MTRKAAHGPLLGLLVLLLVLPVVAMHQLGSGHHGSDTAAHSMAVSAGVTADADGVDGEAAAAVTAGLTPDDCGGGCGTAEGHEHGVAGGEASILCLAVLPLLVLLGARRRALLVSWRRAVARAGMEATSLRQEATARPPGSCLTWLCVSRT